MKGPTLLHCDNLGAVKRVKNPVLHSCIKHIELHHFIKEKTTTKNIKEVFILTDLQEAEIFTKSIGQTSLITYQ